MTVTRTYLRTTILMVSMTALLGAGLSGCKRPAEPEEALPAIPAAPVTIDPQAGSPLAFETVSPHAEVRLVLPEALKSQPDLHAKLYAAAVADLRAFAEGAQADLTEAGGGGAFGKYTRDIVFAPPVETGKLFSLARAASEYTGGAHGMTNHGAVLWDKALKREITGSALFRRGADLSVLDRLLCAALNAEKKSRDAKAVAVTLEGQDWKCPRAAETPFVLAPSTASGKAGGLTFLIDPYIAGPYSEGDFTIDVPQALIRALLAPAYVDEFAGAPQKAPANLICRLS